MEEHDQDSDNDYMNYFSDEELVENSTKESKNSKGVIN